MQYDREAMGGETGRRGLLRLGLMITVCFFFASMMPSGLVMATFSSLLMLGAMVTALFAGFTREPMWVDYPTGWDQSSALFALGLVAGWAVDPEAANEALIQLEQAQAPAS